MPPKVKVSREDIVNAAVEVIRENGHEKLNARSIADRLKCSTQPVLYSFRTVDEIREAAYESADHYHSSYIMPKDTDDDPLLMLGMNYVRFAHEEKNLFRFLFQTDKFGGMDIDSLLNNEDLSGIMEIMAKGLDVEIKEAREMFFAFFLVVHGLASLLANNSMEYDESRITRILENVFNGFMTGKGR